MSQEPTLVLNHEKIWQKLRRIAYQLYEFNHEEKEITFVAIEKKGVLLAERIIPILKDISGIEVNLIKLSVDKENPNQNPAWDSDTAALVNRSVILVDDVLNSGKTLIYAARHILDFDIKKLTTVVLVDRMHRRYPIKADFVGLTLSTTMQDHIAVEFKKGDDRVYLV
ncbi:MAG: phosphoribosyltransferase [Flavobacteriales bacterium]|nr:phosphoribosyltransferase [Flavobacteriales bacterium]